MSSEIEGHTPAVSGLSVPSTASDTTDVETRIHQGVLAHRDPRDAKVANQEVVVVPQTVDAASSLIFTPPQSKLANMESGPLLDTRALVRLIQCKQCSIPLRTPMTLPCGNSICPPCLPERHKRENITYPLLANRREGFICPFQECGQEHTVADCAVDVTLTKIIERMSLCIAEHQELNPDSPLKLLEQLRPRTEIEIAQMELHGSEGPLSRSRVEDGGYLAATYIMAERRELRYDSELEFVTQGGLSVDAYQNLDTDLFAKLRHQVRQEMDCQLCWNLLYDPLTTPCGHTFCRNCVARILDHSTACPFCRKPLHLPPGVKNEVGNKAVQKLLEAYCAEDLATRTEAIRIEQEEASRSIPLFVCTLAYPGMPTFLHIFEPRYRLMIRRALETESRTFGMATYNERGTPQGDDLGPNVHFLRHGTLLRIVHCEQIPGTNGRLLIECVGVGRFNVKEWHEHDGYIVAQTESIEDVGFEQEERIEAEEVQNAGSAPPTQEGEEVDPIAQLEGMSTADLLSVSVDFVQRMRDASAPWLNINILRSYGEPPYTDARMFPYWFASVVPISENEKYTLIGTTSVRERLKITARWVKRIEAQRWFSVSSCHIA